MSARDARRARLLGDVACAFGALALAVVLYRGWRTGLWLNRPYTPFDAPLLAFAHTHPLPPSVRFSLPDALWQYALVATMAAVWRGERWDRTKTAFVLLPGAAGAFVELAQWAKLFPGTFDPADLLASLLATSLALAIHGGVLRAFSRQVRVRVRVRVRVHGYRRGDTSVTST